MKFSLRHQSTGWLYPYITPAGKSMFYGFFRNVFVHNRHGVPSDRPVLLAANHPTASIDPYLLGIYLDPPLYNMTRGDIFEKPLLRKLLASINMFPVFRVRDGYVSRDRNDEVFEYCVGKLRDRRVVTIYVEGEHHLEKRVRPAQKGLARIAFAAFERHALDDLVVIPVGCNYMYGDRPRDTAHLVVGQPIAVRDYRAEYERSAASAIARLTADVEAALKTVCYHVEDPADFALAERLLTLQRGTDPAPWLPLDIYSGRRFFQEKAVLDRLNGLPAAEKHELDQRTTAYFARLDRAGLDDAALVNARRWAHPAWWLFFAFGLPFFLTGRLAGYPVGLVAKRFTQKNVRKREFYSSVMVSVGFIFGLVYYPLLMLVALISFHPVWIGLAFSLPFLGWFALLYGDRWERFRGALKARRSAERTALLTQRREIYAGTESVGHIS